VSLLEAGGLEHPLVQPLAAVAERLVETRVGTRGKAVE
jgi:hypothetical protein